MIVVLDANAAMEIVLNREYGEQFKGVLKKSDLVITPNTFASEITNSFWKYAMHKELSEEQCQKGIEYCLDLVDDFIDTNSMCKEVFSEAIDQEHSAYDVYYLVLARRNNAVILTRDKKMKNIASIMKIDIA